MFLSSPPNLAQPRARARSHRTSGLERAHARPTLPSRRASRARPRAQRSFRVERDHAPKLDLAPFPALEASTVAIVSTARVGLGVGVDLPKPSVDGVGPRKGPNRPRLRPTKGQGRGRRPGRDGSNHDWLQVRAWGSMGRRAQVAWYGCVTAKGSGWSVPTRAQTWLLYFQPQCPFRQAGRKM